MPDTTTYKILEACHEPGCPVCRLEQQSVERYLDNHFYENVNSPAWRDRLRLSLGLCHEHAWLGVNQRLGDALGYAIIYHDIVNTILDRLDEGTEPKQGTHRRPALLQQTPKQAQTMMEKMLSVLAPRQSCPVCEHRDETVGMILSVLVEGLKTPEMTEALRDSEGLCLPHLRLALEHIKHRSTCEKLLSIQREKLENLKDELAEFIRKNDYQRLASGFGKEGNAWLRAVALIVGSRKNK